MDDYNRLLAAYCDLAEGRDMFAAYLLFADDPKSSEAYGMLPDGLADRIESALLVTGIISYARPFVQSRGGGRSKLPKRLLKSLSREEFKVHQFMIEARNRILAHSDADLFDVKMSKVGNVPIRSVAPSPVVVMRGEGDSMSLKKAIERVSEHREHTMNQFVSIISELEDGKGPSCLTLVTSRMIEMEAPARESVIDIAEKVMDAITSDLRQMEET